MRFTWHEKKDEANQAKHGISFGEASALFSSGLNYLIAFDEAHSDDQERFIAVGPIGRGVIVVIWMEQDEETIRISSARPATKRERAHYTRFAERPR